MPGFDPHTAADALDAAVRTAARPERAEPLKRYLKTDLDVLGASVGDIRRSAKAWRRSEPRVAGPDVVAVAEELWSRPVLECRLAAVEVLVAAVTALDAEDLTVVERMVRTAKSWALVDPLAINVAGPLVERHPTQAGSVLDRWALDGDFWVRRSALLALLAPLREGGGDFDRFARYADAMLEEREFFVRKAIGWVLRETARRRPDLVAGWLAPRMRRASGVTVREAVKHLPDDVRTALLAQRAG